MNLSQVEKISQKIYLGVAEEDIIKDIESLECIEECDREGRTLLINASFCGYLMLVSYLLENKANVNAKDKADFTALHMAAQEGNLDIIKVLLENGADINAKDKFGNSPLMRVRMIKDPQKTVSLLLEYNADIYQKNNYGVSASDMFYNSPEIRELLRMKTGDGSLSSSERD